MISLKLEHKKFWNKKKEKANQKNCKRRETRLSFILLQFTLLKSRKSEQCNEMMNQT